MGAISSWFVNALNTRRETARAPSSDPSSQVVRVLVCGASGAIGGAVAKMFAAQGAQLFLHYHHNEGKVEKLARSITQTYPQLTVPQLGRADLRDEVAARVLVGDAWNRMGGIDVLVTSLGGAKDGPLLMVDAADVVECMEQNLRPVINVCEAFRVFCSAKRGGRIINISSITGLVGQPMRVAYGAAKGAVISYTKSLAREVAADGVTANVVAPQVIEGGLADLMKSRVRDILLSNTPMGRACTPEDVAHGVSYLASPSASFVTGTVSTVTGGLVTW